jgi:hypothetical protein
LGAGVDLSPRSATLSNEAPAIRDDTGATAETSISIRTTSSRASIGLLAGYDTAGRSDLEWSFSAGLSLDRLQTQQRLAAFRNGSLCPPAISADGARTPGPAVHPAWDSR